MSKGNGNYILVTTPNLSPGRRVPFLVYRMSPESPWVKVLRAGGEDKRPLGLLAGGFNLSDPETFKGTLFGGVDMYDLHRLREEMIKEGEVEAYWCVAHAYEKYVAQALSCISLGKKTLPSQRMVVPEVWEG